MPGLVQIAAGPIFCPFYHCVTDEPGDHVKRLFPIRNPRTFRDDLEFLAHSFAPLSLSDLVNHAREGRPLPPRAMFLSFDDGLREVADEIAPLCKRVGVPATFFLNSASLDNRFLCFRHKASLLIENLSNTHPSLITEVARLMGLPDGVQPEIVIQRVADARVRDTHTLDLIARVVELDFETFLHQRQPYLTTKEVQTLLVQGFEIGAHSVDHPHYSDLPLPQQVCQTVDCARDLKARFGLERISFAFPFTSDGVEQPFFDEVLGREIVDLIFCVGAMPANETRVLQRAWMESDAHLPVQRIMRDFHTKELSGRLLSGIKNFFERRWRVR